MAKDDVTLAIGGEVTGLVAALAQAREATVAAAEQMRSALDSVNAGFERINAAMLAVTAVLAGGKAFKEAIDASVSAATSAAGLAKQLGITATQASVLRVAMDENYVSSDAVSAGATRVAQTLRKNEDAFTSLGVAVRDGNGNFRNSFDIMQDVNGKLLEFKEGTDRNVEGQKIYGRGWADIAPTLKLTATAMEEAKAKADALGLTVGEEGIAQAKEYRTTMAGVGEVFEGVKKAIGDALLPYLTELGQWFESVGPQAVEYTKKAFLAILTVVEAVKFGIVTFFQSVMLVVEEVVTLLLTISDTLDRVLHFDFAGAKAAWTNGWDQMKQIAQDRVNAVQQSMDDASSSIADAAGRAFGAQTPTKQKDGLASDGTDSKKSHMSEFTAQLEEKKVAYQQEQLAEGSFREFSKEQELAYWRDILSAAKLSLEERRQVRSKVAGAELAVEKQNFDDQLAQLKTQEAEHKNNATARRAIEQEYASKVKAAYGEDSKEYSTARQQIIATERQVQDQLQKIKDIQTKASRDQQLSEIAIAEQGAKERYDMHAVSLQQYIAQLQQFENQKYAIRRAALQDELTLEQQRPDSDPVKVAQLNAQLEQLAQQHQQALGKINQQGAQESIGYYKQFDSAMSSGFQSAITGMLNGTQTLAQGVKNLFKSMLDAVINVLAQMAARWMANMIMEMVFGKATAASQISANAGIAATAAMASVAAIPFYGWAMAPEVGAATFGEAMAYNASLSAAGGFDVPASVNPVTQLHQREMVLPAKYADVIRGLGDGGQGGNGPVNVTLKGKDLGNHFMMHKADLISAINELVRDGHLRAPS